MASIGRNDPCPCGSGKKYKRCCLASSPPQGASPKRAWQHDLDERLVVRISDFLRRRLPVEIGQDGYDEYFADDEPADSDAGLFSPWMLFDYRTDGKSVADRFIERYGERLEAAEAGWLEAQRRAWLSVWEVLEVRRGEGVVVVDLLTGERRYVLERSASEMLEPRLGLLARVADHDGVSLFVGMHGAPLQPRWTAVVVECARKAMQMGRARHVTVDRMRNPETTAGLVNLWRRVVRTVEEAPPPQFANTDGEPLLLTTDRFSFEPGTRGAVVAALEGIELAARHDDEEDEAVVVFHKLGNAMIAQWDNTVLGHARVRDGTLLVESNSLARSDGLRASIEEACGALVRHVIREHTDPQVRMRDARPPRDVSADAEVPPEVAQIALDFKRQHYEAWIDAPLPALGDKSPRETARTPAGRRQVEVMLKEIELSESRAPEGQRWDVAELRESLGMREKNRPSSRQLELAGLAPVGPSRAPKAAR